MSAKKSVKKTSNKKPTPQQESVLHKGFRFLRKAKDQIADHEDVDPEFIRNRKENNRFIFGSILLLVSLAVLTALVSHLFTGAEDQRIIQNGMRHATNWMGTIGYYIAHWLMDNTFGVSSILIPIFLIAASIRIIGIAKVRLHLWFLNCMILMIWASAFAAFIVMEFPIAEDTHIIWGGMIGRQELELCYQKVGSIGTILIFVITALLYLFYLSENAITSIRQFVVRTHDDAAAEADADADEVSVVKDVEDNPIAATEVADPSIEETATVIPLMDNTDVAQTDMIAETDMEISTPFADEASTTATTIDFGTTESASEPNLKEGEQLLPLDFGDPKDDMTVVVGQDPEKADLEEDGSLEPYDPKLDLEFYRYPSIDLLKHYDEKTAGIDMDEQQANKERIIEVLRNFRVEISSIKATIGPTITLYEITPAPGIRINTIRHLEDDIALSIRAIGIRIIAPIPGKGTIGIEVPNARPQMVSMESILNSRKFQETDFELPMALGKTITNEVFMVDLAKMPHLLVAGATGQGKSVGLNAIITSLLYKKHPAELKLVMVDPKKVEFSVYSPIVNHFLAQVEGNEDSEEPIITDVNKVIQTLKSLCVEMDTRYDLLKMARARNVKEYNQKFKNRELNPQKGHKFMPYIVVIIDEFGDLIMTAGREIEMPIARIAQLARAVGIHMIIATQRPAVNIITGTIKANFPARMAFKVASGIDSKTILDRTGAHQLVGKGDMLFMTGTDPVRVQCAFVDTPEVERIVNHISVQQGYLTPFPLPEVPMDGEDGEAPDVDMTHLDPMFEEVARMVVAEQNGSTSMIQRKFSIGYNRAGRLMDQLEKAGVVGPAKGSKPREVLCMSDDQLMNIIENLR